MNNVLAEGISDWLQRQKDNAYTNKINKKQQKVSNARKIENEKRANDTVVEFREYLLDSLGDEPTWEALSKALIKEKIPVSEILNSFTHIFDDLGYVPRYKVISRISKELSDKIGSNTENTSSSNEDGERVSNEELHQRVLAFIDLIREQGSFTDFQIESMAKLVKRDFLDSSIDVETIAIEALKKYEEKYPEFAKSKKEPEEEKDNKKEERKQKLDIVMPALKKLGYSNDEVRKMIKSISAKEFDNLSEQDIIKKCLANAGK